MFLTINLEYKMKNYFILLLFTLFCLHSNAGGVAAGIWTAILGSCISACVPLVPGSPAYITCVAACYAAGPITSFFTCFSNSTLVMTPSGAISITKLNIGDKILTYNLQGAQIETIVMGLIETPA